MKSFNHLFEPMLEDEEISAAIDEAAEHKHNRPPVQQVLQNKPRTIRKLKFQILHGEWRPPPHTRTILQEGSHRKSRDIEKPEWNSEQIVHHMLMRQFRRLVVPRTYRYACGALSRADEIRTRQASNQGQTDPARARGRGPLFAARAMRRWITEYHGHKFYVAELDIKSFYNTIDKDTLKGKLAKFIRDKRYLQLLFRVLDGSGPGLPKGYYTSPWLAHFYLMDMDNFILQQLKPDHYLRYMDNLFLFSRNKKELHRAVLAIRDYLQGELHLEINQSWQVFRYEYQDKSGRVRGRTVNCLGYVLHHNRTTLRKTILKRARAKALRMHRNHRCTRQDAACMISYKGWFQHTDTYDYYERWIKPNISMRYCRLKVARAARAGQKAKRKEGDAQ